MKIIFWKVNIKENSCADIPTIPIEGVQSSNKEIKLNNKKAKNVIRKILLILLTLILFLFMIELSFASNRELKEPYKSIREFLFEPPESDNIISESIDTTALKGWRLIADRLIHWWEDPISTEELYKDSIDNFNLLAQGRPLGYKAYKRLLQLGVKRELIADHIYFNYNRLTPEYEELLLTDKIEGQILLNIGYEHKMIEDFDSGSKRRKDYSYIDTVATYWAGHELPKISFILFIEPKILRYIDCNTQAEFNNLPAEQQAKALFYALYDYNYLVLLEHSLEGVRK